MKSVEERKALFIRELEELLEKHNAELGITDYNDLMFFENIEVTMNEYDTNGVKISDFKFKL